MKDLPPIDSRVRLNGFALERLGKGKSRARDPKIIGTVTAHSNGRASVRWDSDMPDELLNPIYLELAT